MFTTLVAVIVALVLGHVAAPAMASLRRFGWYARWLDWLGGQLGADGPWGTRGGIALALLPPVLLVLLLQLALSGVLYGLLALLFGIVVLALAWGPRDLDVDVEAVLDADDPATRRTRLGLLAPAPGEVVAEGPARRRGRAAGAVVRARGAGPGLGPARPGRGRGGGAGRRRPGPPPHPAGPAGAGAGRGGGRGPGPAGDHRPHRPAALVRGA